MATRKMQGIPISPGDEAFLRDYDQFKSQVPQVKDSGNGLVAGSGSNGEDRSVTPQATSSTQPQAKASFWNNPRAFLQQRAADLNQEAQRQMNMATDPEAEGHNILSRLGHSTLSYMPATAAVVDRSLAGLMDWKNAAAVAAGAIDPAIPAAYFGTQGIADLTGLNGQGSSIKRAIQNPTPENVQQPFLSGAQVFAGASAAGSPNAGTVGEAAENLAKDVYYPWRTTAARAVEPLAANLPPQAVFGAERIYRVAATAGNNPQFRANLYKAAGDLAEIGRKIDLEEAKGGIIQPDMRVRATVNAINEHLTEMYQNEKAPQIARNAQNPIGMQFGEDAVDGLTYLARHAGSAAIRGLVARALASDHLPLADVDRLGGLINRELRDYESTSAGERADASIAKRNLDGLKAVDNELGNKIDAELQSRGEPGLKGYKDRYATLSAIRDQLQNRMNAVELKQPGIIKGIAGPIANVVARGKSDIVSALPEAISAIPDASIGAELQQGLKDLSDSGITGNRGMPKVTPKMAPMQPIGLPVPEEMEMDSAINHQLRSMNAPFIIVRDQNGQMRKKYLKENNGQ